MLYNLNIKYKMYGNKIQKPEIVLPFNKNKALAYTILSFISLALSIFLLVWVILKQYGLLYTSPIQLTLCIQPYYLLKYSNNIIIIALWVSIILSLTTSLILTIIWVSRTIAKAVTQGTKYATAILQSLNCLSSGVFTGYCLTFFIQFNKINPSDCVAVYDFAILITFTGIGIGIFLLNLIRYIICLCREIGNESSEKVQKQEQKQNYESLVNVTNDSFRQKAYLPKQYGSSTVKQHPIREYAPNKIKQYPINPRKKQYPTNQKQYPQRLQLVRQYPSYQQEPHHYRQYNNTDLNTLSKAIPRNSKSPKKIKYVGQHQSVKSEEWQTVAPSKADRYFIQQPRRLEERQLKSRFDSGAHPSEDKVRKNDFIDNIFLDNQSQSSRNQPLFVPQQPFHYQSLAAKIINKNRRDQGLSKVISAQNIEPQTQMQLFGLKEDDGIWVAPTPVRIQSEKSKVYAPLAIRKNYQRRLNKY